MAAILRPGALAEPCAAIMHSPWHSCDARPRSSFTCKSAGPVYDSENMGEGHEADKDMRRTPGIAAAVMAALLAGYAPFAADARSEEHTSELQSLMRISYAVFCLKKKKNNKTKKTHISRNITT